MSGLAFVDAAPDGWVQAISAWENKLGMVSPYEGTRISFARACRGRKLGHVAATETVDAFYRQRTALAAGRGSWPDGWSKAKELAWVRALITAHASHDVPYTMSHSGCMRCKVDMEKGNEVAVACWTQFIKEVLLG